MNTNSTPAASVPEKARHGILGIIATASLLASAAPAWAVPYVHNGSTLGDPTWNRPVSGTPPVPPLSLVGTSVPYDIFAFTVSGSGLVNFVENATVPFGWDNYTFLYQNSFSAAAPFTNVLIGNDDFPSIGISGFSYNLNAGTQYYLISTGFDNGDAGDFSLLITPDANVSVLPGDGSTSVPEPASLLLLGTGLAGIYAARSRRRRS